LEQEEAVPEGYPFGVYFCHLCRTVMMWYPDTKKHPELNRSPNILRCITCGEKVKLTEEFWIGDIWSDLVPTFLHVVETYPFKKAIICDEAHIHFVWERKAVTSSGN